jgi:hypothetical protein
LLFADYSQNATARDVIAVSREIGGAVFALTRTMARFINEVMNRELLAVLPDTRNVARSGWWTWGLCSSVLDVLRAILGIPAHHPATFPHWDAPTQTSWTDEWPFDEEHASQAPETAGVLVLSRGLMGETDAVVWVEACENVRDRISSLAALGSSAEPALARLLERHDLRFRATSVSNDLDREHIASTLNDDLAHRPRPGGP